MGIEKIIQSIIVATPTQRRAVEDALRGNTAAAKSREDDNRLVSITAAAKLLGLGRNCVYALIEDGRLDVVELNGNRRVTMKSIREFANGERPANEKTEERRRGYSAAYAQAKTQKEGRGE